MKDKILSFIGKLTNKLKVSTKRNRKIRLDIIKFIVGYIIFVFTLFLVGWCFLWYVKGLPDLMLLLEGIKALSAPAVLAVVKFICDSTMNFVDKNNNGIPDELEEGNNRLERDK
ncbi:hypothetical protein [Phascolarctobacterium succinatutens]|jgi:hypothetical protein|uniref:hypothetical protein n=1 Tax=Phascolarctobacterium succinatutens TaxID=626940 RepID=UPI00207049CB|nr:MAG TPA: hypothetical protein [Caudoviricetes sp.]